MCLFIALNRPLVYIKKIMHHMSNEPPAGAPAGVVAAINKTGGAQLTKIVNNKNRSYMHKYNLQTILQMEVRAEHQYAELKANMFGINDRHFDGVAAEGIRVMAVNYVLMSRAQGSTIENKQPAQERLPSELKIRSTVPILCILAQAEDSNHLSPKHCHNQSNFSSYFAQLQTMQGPNSVPGNLM